MKSRKGSVVVVRKQHSMTMMHGASEASHEFVIGIASACNLQGIVLEYRDAASTALRHIGRNDACYLVAGVSPEDATIAAGNGNSFDTIEDVRAALLPYKSAAQATR
jgi:hypothetical protein